MIGRLAGTLLSRSATEVLLDVHGVGYRVVVPPAAVLGGMGEDCCLFTHQHVREDTLALYGFPTEKERDLFELLLLCQGVGPKVALACVSVLGPATLTRAVCDKDFATLTLVPGVGKRSAEKLVFELGPRLLGQSWGGMERVGASADRAEVSEALVSLGYAEREVASVLTDLPEEEDTSALLRAALRVFGGRE